MSTAPARPTSKHRQRYWQEFEWPKTGVAAVGTVTCDTNANAADGNTLTLNDGFRKVTYEYDKSANGVTAGNVSWAAGTTAASNATALAALIASNQPAFSVSDNLAGVLTLTHRLPGAIGNNAIVKSGAVIASKTDFAGGVDPGGSLLADTTYKIKKVKTRGIKVTRVTINLPAGLAADASNYCNFKLLKGASTVIANWSTLNSANGALTADTETDMVLTATVADQHLGDGDQLSLFVDVTGSPTVPPGRIEIEGEEL